MDSRNVIIEIFCQVKYPAPSHLWYFLQKDNKVAVNTNQIQQQLSPHSHVQLKLPNQPKCDLNLKEPLNQAHNQHCVQKNSISTMVQSSASETEVE